MNLKIPLLLLLFVLRKELHSQPSVSIRPFLGYKAVFSKVIDKSNALPGFKTNAGNGAPDFGVTIEYNFSQKWSALLGAVDNAAGTSFRHDYRKVGGNSFGAETGYTDILQFNFGMVYHPQNIMPVIRFKNRNTPSSDLLIKQEQRKPPLSAKWAVAAGLGVGFFNETQDDLNNWGSAGSYGYNRDSSVYIQNSGNTYIKKSSFAFYTWSKGGIRFYRFGKEKMEIALLLNIGLITLYTDTDIDGVKKRGQPFVYYNATVGSRGSTLGFQVSFPLTVWRKKPK